MVALDLGLEQREEADELPDSARIRREGGDGVPHCGLRDELAGAPSFAEG